VQELQVVVSGSQMFAPGTLVQVSAPQSAHGEQACF